MNDRYTLNDLKKVIKDRLKANGKDTQSIGPLITAYYEMRKTDPRMPGNLRRTYASEGWKGLHNLFGIEKTTHYTLNELKAAIKKKLQESGEDPSSISSYFTKYHEMRKTDARMPSSPSKYYPGKDSNSYLDLFGIERTVYYTLKELKSAIKKKLQENGEDPSSIRSYAAKYHEMRKTDARMPARPSKHYNKKDSTSCRDLFDAVLYTPKELKEVIKRKLQESGEDSSSISSYVAKYHEMRKTDARMPARPAQHCNRKDFKGIHDLFGIEKVVLYGTLKELKGAIQKRLRKTGKDAQSFPNLMQAYTNMRKTDLRMPRNPSKLSGWIDLYDLFGIDKIVPYRTLEELKTAIQRKLQNSGKDAQSILHLTDAYHEMREEDLRMPCHPSNLDGWIDLYDLFGLEKVVHYRTLEELKTAIHKKLKMNGENPYSFSNYQTKYHEMRKTDPRMPYQPYQIYAKGGWNGYTDLFGTVKYSYHEAQQAALKYVEKNEIELNKVALDQLCSLISQKLPRMPACPSRFYKDFWLGVEYFFQLKIHDSFEEARAKALSKGLSEGDNTEKAYELLRLQDPMIPPSPEKAYCGQWRTFEHFFGVSDGRYRTLHHAQKATWLIAKKLKIKITCRSYPSITKHDDRLPKNIDKYMPYKDDWTSWKDFAGTKKYDLNQTIAIAKKNKWLKFEDYSKEHHIDPKLPADPVGYYHLKSYAELIGFRYWNVDEVKEYCTENKVSTLAIYIKHAKKSPYLRIRYVEIEGCKKVTDFLYTPRAFEEIELLGFEDWAELAQQYLTTHGKQANDLKKRAVKHFLKYLISKNTLPTEPFVLFMAGKHIEALEPIIAQLPKGQKVPTYIIEFLQFAMESCCYDRDEDTGELIAIDPDIHFRHPYQGLSIETKQKTRRIESVKPPLDFVYIEKAKQYLIPDFIIDENGVKRQCNTFSQLANCHELFDADWFEVDEASYQRAIEDPNCATKIGTIAQTGCLPPRQVYKIWSPVRAVAMYFLFNLPLRGLQVCFLDSGEADDFKLIEQDGNLTWVLNDNPLSGQLNDRGFLNRIGTDDIGMKVSTNKTSRQEGGYTVPWMPEDLARWAIRLRDWQSTYNPLSEPTHWSDINLYVDMHEKVLKKRGRQCFLFRDPRDYVKRKTNPPGSQPFSSNAMFSAFEKLLYLIQTNDMPLAKIKTGTCGGSANNYESIYSPHALRVSHISALLFEGDGLDPAIVQKLVGHANLVMTIYYAKINYEQMREKLSGQYKTIAANQQRQYQSSLLTRNIEEAKGELIFLSDGAGRVTWEKSAIHFKDYGMCPVASGRCDVGGPPISPNANNLAYSKAKSCYQCRFFVTGPGFFGGLVAKFNEVNVARKRASERIDKLKQKERKIRLKKKQAEDHLRETDSIKLELEQVRTALDAETVKFYDIGADQSAIFSKVVNCIKKINKSIDESKETDGMALLFNRSKAEVGVSLEESSDFRMLAEVCEDAQLYDSIDDSEAIIRREKFLDAMLQNNGFDAMFYKLDEEQSRYIGNQMQKLLKKRLQGWGGIEDLVYGQIRLSDLRNDTPEKMQSIEHELSLIVTEANQAIARPELGNIKRF